MSDKLVYIFDIDGVLADIEHRLHYILRKDKDWDSFDAKTREDRPILASVGVINALKAAGYVVVLVTGRMAREQVVRDTLDWMEKHGIEFDDIVFRREGDYRPDDVIKEEVLDNIIEKYGEPIAAFEDRKRIVDMYLRRGLYVYDCGQGNGDF